MNELVLETKELGKAYKNVVALEPTNLKLEKGIIYGLIGRNGAGKTTLLKLITGLSAPTSGTISLFNGSEFAQERIGALIEQPAFFPNLTGRQNLEYYRIQRGIAEKSCVSVAISDLGLSEFADRKFKTYSLGNKQRLGIALALLGSPDFLILDEPINGFDPIGVVEIRRLLLELNRKKHLTILISSHILAELEQLITRVGFIEQGRLVEELDLEELRAKVQSKIELEVENPQKAVAILEAQGLSPTLLATGVIQLVGAKKEIPMLSRLLGENNIDVYGIKELEQTLEEYFVNSIGGHRHD